MIEKSLAVQMQDALGENWKVDDIGYSECPRPIIRIYKRSHWWILNYWQWIATYYAGEFSCYTREVAQDLEKLKLGRVILRK